MKNPSTSHVQCLDVNTLDIACDLDAFNISVSRSKQARLFEKLADSSGWSRNRVYDIGYVLILKLRSRIGLSKQAEGEKGKCILNIEAD